MEAMINESTINFEEDKIIEEGCDNLKKELQMLNENINNPLVRIKKHIANYNIENEPNMIGKDNS